VEYLTPYPEVNRVLFDLLDETRNILGEEFVGLYLYGSLAMGDFDERRSDIDFIVVTRSRLAETEIASLEKMHNVFASSAGKWHRKLEGLYIPLSELKRYDPQGPHLPTVNEGRFYLARQGSDWVLQRHVLREHETIVAGPSIREFIDPVSPQEMRAAVSAIMQEWWAPMLDDPTWLDGRPEYQAFAVQTMCRALYTLEFGTAVSKTDAALWAIDALDDGWIELIEEAIAWPDRQPASPDCTLDFIRYAVDVNRGFS